MYEMTIYDAVIGMLDDFSNVVVFCSDIHDNPLVLKYANTLSVPQVRKLHDQLKCIDGPFDINPALWNWVDDCGIERPFV